MALSLLLFYFLLFPSFPLPSLPLPSLPSSTVPCHYTQGHILHLEAAAEDDSDTAVTFELERLRNEVNAQREEILDLRSGRTRIDFMDMTATSADAEMSDAVAALQRRVTVLEAELLAAQTTAAEQLNEERHVVLDMEASYAEKTEHNASSPEAGAVAALVVRAGVRWEEGGGAERCAQKGRKRLPEECKKREVVQKERSSARRETI